jgi:hypothetical protein
MANIPETEFTDAIERKPFIASNNTKDGETGLEKSA